MKFRRSRERRDGIRPNKLLGQHFLVSGPILKKIIAAAELSPNDTVLEVGPGLGTLTVELAQRAQRVIAVEKDSRLIPALEKNLRDQHIANVEIVAGDILKLFPGELALPDEYRVIANIPYYLTSRLIRILLEGEHPPRDILLMVQQEVAKRIVAEPPHMNLLGLAVQTYATPKTLFAVPPRAFSPPPQVSSALVSIKNIGRSFFVEQSVDEKKFFLVARAGFQGRRKILENTLSRNLNIAKPKVREILGAHHLFGKRPETLSREEWARLTHAFANFSSLSRQSK